MRSHPEKEKQQRWAAKLGTFLNNVRHGAAEYLPLFAKVQHHHELFIFFIRKFIRFWQTNPFSIEDVRVCGRYAMYMLIMSLPALAMATTAFAPTSVVVIPAHNAGKTLARTLDSVANQSRKVNEIIVVNDRSLDDTVPIALSRGAKVLDSDSPGPGAARNKGVAASDADVVFFLDADDEWLPEKVESHLAVYERSEPSFVYDPCIRIWPNGIIGKVAGGTTEGEVTWSEMLDLANWACGSSSSVCRKKFEALGGFDLHLSRAEDIEILVRLAHEYGPGHRIGKPLTHYYQHEGSLSRKLVDPAAVTESFFKELPFAKATDRERYLRSLHVANVFTAPQGEFFSTLRKAFPVVWHEPSLYRLIAVRYVRKLQIKLREPRDEPPSRLVL